MYFDAIVSGPTSWTSIGPTFLSNGGISNGGPVFGLGWDITNQHILYVAEDYVSGAEIYSFNLFERRTVDFGSLIPGRYEFGLANGETITMNIGNAFVQAPAAVPLPATLSLLASGLLGASFVARRKKNALSHIPQVSCQLLEKSPDQANGSGVFPCKGRLWSGRYSS